MPISRIKSDGINDASITTAKIADDAVNSAKIGVDVIAAEDLAANSVTVSEISNGAVTGDKLASNLNYDSGTLYLDSTNNRVGIGTTSPSSIFHTEENTTSASIVRHKNTSNTSGAHSRLIIQNGGTSGGDTIINLDSQTSGSRFTLGVDNSANKFVIANADKGSFDGSNEAMVIDSNGNIGIGNNIPGSFYAGGNNLVVGSGSGSEGITIYGGAESNLFFADGTDIADNLVGRIEYSHISEAMLFYTNNSYAMRLDSSGNLLVGKTTEGVNNIGVQLRPDGFVGSTRSSGPTMYLQRQGSDGEILRFQNSSGTVGSIASTTRSGATDIFIGSGDTGIYFTQALDAIAPSNQGSDRDAAIDLGRSASRFKDLYLSGGAYLGGTGSANYLEDYEEGTWTPTYSGSGGSVSMGTQIGRYIKIGKSVYIFCHVSATSSSLTGTLEITGLPFTAASSTTYGWFNATNATWSWNDHPRSVYVVNSTDDIRMWDIGTSQITGSDMVSGNGSNIIFSVHYYSV